MRAPAVIEKQASKKSPEPAGGAKKNKKKVFAIVRWLRM